MVAARAQEADRLVARPPQDVAFYLVYGPDTGLVSERAKAIAAAFADPGDPFALVRIEASDLTANPTRLADEAYAVSMFSSRRAILVRDGGRSDLAGRFRALFKQPPTDTAIVVEAGDLKKSSPLRVLFEQESRAYAIPCFADDERSIGALVDEEVRAAGLSIAAEARALLVSLLGGDRLMTRGEIQKLCLHAHGTGTITLADVETLIGDSSTFAVDEVIDAAAGGALTELVEGLAKARAEGVDAGQIAGAALRHFMLLDELRAAVDGGVSPGDAVNGARPPVFFKRKGRVEAALGLWPPARLARAIVVLGDAARDARLNPALSADIVGETLLTLARAADQAAGRRRR
ncbi:DNA polymerase III subunit delta [Pleomorphomonas diazotrophica]|uniref:DNA polymerase III subunit delta n=1 Tax=Pleomorphomonas diazotrophica TaxID=1166257 RepID=A0A1I4SZD0_9HYPH|nr:DNA polymerase III subunit delta [Pleomorphomonas diazotrophica]PKR88634.1 DNA polymerase III subunit delta [Pleomorphomonas diazotrophica]SFM69673.1 DNA polymerase III, delta subunit [Pleomorphomonas diazotrophica]